VKREWQLPPSALGLFLTWICCGYVFFSLLAVKEPRQSILILFPFVFFAVLSARGLLGRRYGTILAVSFSILNLAFAIIFDKPPYVTGYQEATQIVCQQAPPNSAILFSGQRDGSFIFNMRTNKKRNDLSVLRSERLFTMASVFIRKDTPQIPMMNTEMLKLIKDYGVSYVVWQPNYGNDLTNFRQLGEILQSPQFRLTNTVPISSNAPHHDMQLRIYQNLEWESRTDIPITLDVPTAGMKMQGIINKSH
jgi:hypothetical protein